jgi:hypothetical protein
VGGVAADARGIDGLLILTLVMLAIAVLPLWWLRGVEHHLAFVGGPSPAPEG